VTERAVEEAIPKVYATCPVNAGEELSAAWTVKLYHPAVVGVPEITPVVETIESPGGRVPNTIDQVYGEAPPDTLSV
jgi:hypothetical protein